MAAPAYEAPGRRPELVLGIELGRAESPGTVSSSLAGARCRRRAERDVGANGCLGTGRPANMGAAPRPWRYRGLGRVVVQRQKLGLGAADDADSRAVSSTAGPSSGNAEPVPEAGVGAVLPAAKVWTCSAGLCSLPVEGCAARRRRPDEVKR